MLIVIFSINSNSWLKKCSEVFKRFAETIYKINLKKNIQKGLFAKTAASLFLIL